MRTRKRWRLVAAVATIGLVAAACGGGDKKPTAGGSVDNSGTNETTTTLVGETASTLPGETTTTAVSGTGTGTGTGTGSKTATTVRKTTGTTAKRGNVLTQATTPNTVAGIAQVSTTASTAPAEPPQPGGTLTMLLGTEGNGFDPSLSSGSIGGTDPLKLFAVYDGLVYADGASGSIVPLTAENMTTTNAIDWKLKVRSGIKFADGTAYDAAAIKFNWDRCKNDPALACSQAPTLKTWVYDVQAGDPLTFNIKLPGANGQFPRIISIGGGGLGAIASPAWLAGKSRADVLNSKPVGAGPFVLKEWLKDSHMTLVRSPSYWNQPKPYIDELIFRPVVDESQRINTFKGGQADLITLTQPTNVVEIQKSHPVASVASINSTIQMFNVGRPPFNDLGARKAIELILDREEINKTIFGGVLEAPKGYFPANLPYSDSSLQFPAKNQAEAQRLVNEWRAKNNNQVLEFTWSSSNSGLNASLAQLVQQQVQKLDGVKMNLKLQATVQHTQDIRDKNFDIIGTVYTGVDPEPQVFQTLQTNGARGSLHTGYTNGDVDKAIADSRAATDPAVRNAALKAMQKAALDTVPLLVINRNPTFVPYKPNLKDLAFFDEGGLLSDRVWIKSKG